jgi:hypothetical protein
MRLGILTIFILVAGGIFSGCGSAGTEQASVTNGAVPDASPSAEATIDEENYWAKENFDLERVGNVLKRSNTTQEFESFLNDSDGINNLDLNGDGYVDYISVDEFGEGDRERGLSLYTRYGPDEVQDIGTVYFYRDNYDAPGSRVVLRGNDVIYGDDRYYESNWVDQTIGIVSALFGHRDNYYRSPYYYNNYPDTYDPYEVVPQPIYRTRIQRVYADPVFVYSPEPEWFPTITIRSPHYDSWYPNIYARLEKPRPVHIAFREKNPKRPPFVKYAKGNRGVGPINGKNNGIGPGPGKEERKAEKRDDKLDRKDDRGNPGKGSDKGRDNGKGQGKGKGKGKP